MSRYWSFTQTLEKAAWYFSPEGAVYQNLEVGFSAKELADHKGPLCESDDTEELIQTINHGCPNLHIIGPISKTLACGDEGMGGMASVADLVESVRAV